jgi:hypothetical protein
VPPRTSFNFARIQRVGLGPLLGLLMEPLDIGLELPSIDPPDASAADLDRRKVARSDERIDLGHAHVEVIGDIFERHEPRFGSQARRESSTGVFHLEHENNTRSLQIRDFKPICCRLTPVACESV